MARNQSTDPQTNTQIVFFSELSDYNNLSSLNEAGRGFLNQMGFTFESAALASISSFFNSPTLKNGETVHTRFGEREVFDIIKGSGRGLGKGFITEKGEDQKVYLNINLYHNDKTMSPSVGIVDQRNRGSVFAIPMINQVYDFAKSLSDDEKKDKRTSLIDKLNQKIKNGDVPSWWPRTNFGAGENNTIERMIDDSLRFSVLKKVGANGRETPLTHQDVEFYTYTGKSGKDGKPYIGVALHPKTNIPLSLRSVQEIEARNQLSFDERLRDLSKQFVVTTKDQKSNIVSQNIDRSKDVEYNPILSDNPSKVVGGYIWQVALKRYRDTLKDRNDDNIRSVIGSHHYTAHKNSEFNKHGVLNLSQSYAQLVKNSGALPGSFIFPQKSDEALKVCHEVNTVCDASVEGGASAGAAVVAKRLAFERYLEQTPYPVLATYYQQARDNTDSNQTADKYAHWFVNNIYNNGYEKFLLIPYQSYDNNANPSFAFQHYVPVKNDETGDISIVKRTTKGSSLQGHHLMVRDIDEASKEKSGTTIILAEGVGTAVAIDMAIGENDGNLAVVSYGSATNLQKTMEKLDNLFHEPKFIIAADNDFGKTRQNLEAFVDKYFGGTQIAKQNNQALGDFAHQYEEGELRQVLSANAGLTYAKQAYASGSIPSDRIAIIHPNSVAPFRMQGDAQGGLGELSGELQGFLEQGLIDGSIQVKHLANFAETKLSDVDYDDYARHVWRKGLVQLAQDGNKNPEEVAMKKTEIFDSYSQFVANQINQTGFTQIKPAALLANEHHLKIPVSSNLGKIRAIQAAARERYKEKANEVNMNSKLDQMSGFSELAERLKSNWGGEWRKDNVQTYHKTIMALHGVGWADNKNGELTAIAVGSDDIRKLVFKELIIGASLPNSLENKIYKPMMDVIINDSKKPNPLINQDNPESKQWLSIAKTYQLIQDIAVENQSLARDFGTFALNPTITGLPSHTANGFWENLNQQVDAMGLDAESRQALVVAGVTQGVIKGFLDSNRGENDATLSLDRITEIFKDNIIVTGQAPKQVETVAETIHSLAKAGVYNNPEIADKFYTHLGKDRFNPGESQNQSLTQSMKIGGVDLKRSEDRFVNDGPDGANNSMDYKIGINNALVVRNIDDMYVIGNQTARTSDLIVRMSNEVNVFNRVVGKATNSTSLLKNINEALNHNPFNHHLLQNHISKPDLSVSSTAENQQAHSMEKEQGVLKTREKVDGYSPDM